MTEKEWRMFNDILLEIYYAGSLETFGERCLKLIRILIPYTQGYFLVIDEDGRLDVAHSVFENVHARPAPYHPFRFRLHNS